MIPAVLILAFWPLLDWYCRRMLDPTDPSWGILALAGLIWSLKDTREEEKRPSGVDYRWPLAGLLFYIGATFWAPPLLQASAAVFVMTSIASQKRFGVTIHLGVLTLGLLALPILSSLQFYLGYPLRIGVTRCSIFLIRWNGANVHPEGAGIKWLDKTVLVDAPCSGINMLWVALLVSSLLAILENLSQKRTALFLGVAFSATVAANIVRATALFYVEADIISSPHWAHSAIGLSVFGSLILGLGLLARSLAGEERHQRVNTHRLREPFLFAALVAATSPLLMTSPKAEPIQGFPGWPDTFEGRQLQELPLTNEEARFYSNFPGRAGRFTDGKREVILRWVTSPTRSLHPSSDCFKGLGYGVGALAIEEDWRVFLAWKDGTALAVREQITDSNGKSWSDVSAWYWDALLGRGEGPYWVKVVAQRKDRS